MVCPIVLDLPRRESGLTLTDSSAVTPGYSETVAFSLCVCLLGDLEVLNTAHQSQFLQPQKEGIRQYVLKGLQVPAVCRLPKWVFRWEFS